MLEAIDLEPKTVVLELEIVVPGPKPAEVVVHYNYKDSGTQDVAEAHMC